MTIIDRFTRDRVSRYVWAVLTLACVLTAVLAGQRQVTDRNNDVTNQVGAAEAQSLTIANTVMFTNLSYNTMIHAIPSPLYRDIIVAVEGHAFTNATVARVRVWRPDGILQFSTHERDQVGTLQTQDKTLIDQAMAGRSAVAKVQTKFSASSTGNDQTPTTLLEVFVPLHVPDRISITGVVEVDYYYNTLVQALPHPWFKLIVIFSVMALLFLIMALLSLRAPEPAAGGSAMLGLGGELAEPRRSGRHAAGASSDKASRTQQRNAELADARAVKAEADAAGMLDQLGESRDHLKQAEEAYHFLEAKMKQTLADLSVASDVAAQETAQIADLQASLALADAKIASLSAEGAEGVPDSRIGELEHDIGLALDRAHVAEQRTREAEVRALAAEDKALESASRARSTEAAAGASVAEPLATPQGVDPEVAQAQAELALAHEQVLAELASAQTQLAAKEQDHAAITQKLTSAKADLKEAKQSLKSAQAEAIAAAQAQPPSQPTPPVIDDGVFAQLEERIVGAEKQARDAEGRLKDLHETLGAATEVSSDVEVAAVVGDLRTRLARTAARKRLGADERPASAPVTPATTVQAKSGPEIDLQRSMAGEIRGPLSTLKGLSLSLKGAVSTGEGKEMVRQLNASLKKLDRLATDLAEVGEISDGSLRLNRRNADLEALVSRVVGEADGIKDLDVRMELEPARAYVDPVRLQQIVDGMLNHALERTRANGTIRIRLTGDDDGATIAVEDEGAPDGGISPQLQLASRLAELHGGRLWSEPRTSGDGDSVRVFLPAESTKT